MNYRAFVFTVATAVFSVVAFFTKQTILHIVYIGTNTSIK